jgi:hypothetical protein
MDNITPLVPGTDCFVTLTPSQLARYQQSSLKIRSPDGEQLEIIGHDIQKENIQDQKNQLLEQICLTRSLSCHIEQSLELPARAVYALSDLLFRMEEFCERNIK